MMSNVDDTAKILKFLLKKNLSGWSFFICKFCESNGRKMPKMDINLSHGG